MERIASKNPARSNPNLAQSKDQETHTHSLALLIIEQRLSSNAQNDCSSHSHYLTNLLFTSFMTCGQYYVLKSSATSIWKFIQIYQKLLQVFIICMAIFNKIREVRDGKKYEAATITTMRKSKNSETGHMMSVKTTGTPISKLES